MNEALLRRLICEDELAARTVKHLLLRQIVKTVKFDLLVGGGGHVLKPDAYHKVLSDVR